MKRYIKSSKDDAFVGIWWYTDSGEVIGVMKSLSEAELDGNYYQYSSTENHMTLWKSVCQAYFEDSWEQIYNLGYKGLERGRIIYDTRTQTFVITCSANIANDIQFRKAVIDAFNLTGCRYDFEVLSHYAKLPLTGNPAIDSMNYEM